METKIATSRKAGLTFEEVQSARFAVSHAERTELHEPSYLLPVENRLPNKTIFSVGSEDEIAALFKEAKEKMSVQAKIAGVSPFWEAVVVLPDPDEYKSYEEYQEVIDNRLMNFKEEFEKQYICKVLHMSSHLDEGVVKNGIVKRNAHAHILISRMRDAVAENEKKRKRHQTRTRVNKRREGAQVLWAPGRAELGRVQTLYANCMQMTRGSTLEDRGGMPSRKHLRPQQWRELKARENALELSHAAELQEVQSAIAHVQTENDALKRKNTALTAKPAVEMVALAEANYKAIRAFLKGTGKAKQSDYQALKKLHDAGHTVIQSWADYIDKTDDAQIDAEKLLWAIRGNELSVLNELREPSSSGASGGAAGRFDAGVELHIAPLKQWKREDEDLYLLPQKNDQGKRLAFIDHGDKISVKILDYAIVIEAMKVSAGKWPNGFEIWGPSEFVQAAEQACADLDIENYRVRGRAGPDDLGPSR